MVAYLRRRREDARANLEAKDKSDAVGECQRSVPLRLAIAAAIGSIIDQTSVFC